MRIQHVEVIGFGPFAEKTEVTFPTDGISIVTGPNESGKSMLMKAIFGIIFGLSQDEVERCRGWYSPAEFEGRVRLVLADSQIEVVRYFDTQVAEIWDVTPPTRRCLFTGNADPASKDATYFVELAKLVGFEDAEIATGTTFVINRDMETRVSDKLRQMISGSKRADYEKILQDLRAQFARLTRVDPWSATDRSDDGLIERLEGELGRLGDARTQVEEALRTSFRLQGEIRTLEEQLRNIQGQVEEEGKALEGVSVLEGLLREERSIEERKVEVQNTLDAVKTLQTDLSEARDQVASEFAPLIPLQPTFLDDVQALAEARRELARVDKEIETENNNRADLQGQIKKLTEDLTALYGAFEDLPEDFPEKLSLFAARQKELTSLTAQLKTVEKKIAALDKDIDANFSRFVRFEDDHSENLRNFGPKEAELRQKIKELQAERSRHQQLLADIKKIELQLSEEYLPYADVAADFPSRLRAWHVTFEERESRARQVERARADVADVETALAGEHADLQDKPATWGIALKSWRTLRDKVEMERPRLEKERDNLVRLHEERKEAAAQVDQRFAALVDKVKPDFPEKLRELKRLKEEYASKTRIIEEARDRLKAAEDALLNRYSRFLEKDGDWGSRLDEHRKNVHRGDTVLERLAREEEQYHEIRRELENLTSLAQEEGEMFEGVSDSFPELLREYSRLKPEVDSREKNLTELKETIHSLQEMALQQYSEFFGVGDDFSERMTQYKADVETQRTLSKEIKRAHDQGSAATQKLSALEAAMVECYPQFSAAPSNLDTLLTRLDTLYDEWHQQQSGLQEAQAKLTEISKPGRRGRPTEKLSMLIGRPSPSAKEEASQEQRITDITQRIATIEDEIQQIRTSLGNLAERTDNNDALRAEWADYQNLIAERNSVSAQAETSRTTAAKLQESLNDLESRLQHHRELLEAGSEGDTESLLNRYKEYQTHMARLNTARKSLKTLSAPVKGDDAKSSTELERSQKRLSELATALGSFAARFSPDLGSYDDLVRNLIDGFRTYKRRKQEMEKLKARLSNLPNEKDITASRNEVTEMVGRERGQLGLQEGESVDDLLEQWHDYERMQSRIEAEEGIIRSHEQEVVEDGTESKPRLVWLSNRLEQLKTELGDLADHADLDSLIEDILTYQTLTVGIVQIDHLLANLTPLAAVEGALADLKAEEQAGLKALGLAETATPDIDAMESAYARWTKAVESLEVRKAALATLLESEGQGQQATTILDRLDARLQELAQGLGEFTRLSDLDDTLHHFEEFKVLRARVDDLKTMLDGMRTEKELEDGQQQAEAELDAERDKLGLGKDESLGKVITSHAEYAQRVAVRRTEQDVRTRVLSNVSVGDRSDRTTKEVLAELRQNLDDLREALGGFEDAGEEADEVIAQFREAQKLKRDIETLRQGQSASRSVQDLEEWHTSTEQPVLELEKKLKPVGDLTDLDALRARFKTFEDLQQSITSTRRALEQHLTVEELEASLAQHGASVQETEERIRTLLSDRPTLHRWYDKYSHRFEDLRPNLNHALDRLRENASVLELALDKTRTAWRQHMQPTTGTRGNLAVLTAQLARREKELHRARIRRDGLRLAIDLLDSIILDTAELLTGGLQIRAQAIMNELTRGRYSEVTLDGPQLEPVLKSNQGTLLRGESLTGGLKDQLYFALRAALAQEMAGNIHLPFILDDPFVQFDNVRLEQAREYLQTLSERTQVILFTRDDRCRPWGTLALDLAADKPVAASLNGEAIETASAATPTAAPS